MESFAMAYQVRSSNSNSNNNNNNIQDFDIKLTNPEKTPWSQIEMNQSGLHAWFVRNTLIRKRKGAVKMHMTVLKIRITRKHKCA